MSLESDSHLFTSLVPPVKKIVRHNGSFDFFRGGSWFCRCSDAITGRLADLMTECSGWQATLDQSQAALLFECVPGCFRAQGYCIEIAPTTITVRAGDDAGLYYGALTLLQLIEHSAGCLPCSRIEDFPDFPVRGVMLDISRDKVPSMATLFELVDKLARLKINHLQLYMEHTFAYVGHEKVWCDASPLTAAEVRQLECFCAKRFVELVPCQNSFGHLERWLELPDYNDLAALPHGGAPLPWGGTQNYPSAINPLDPRSLDLLDDLYTQLLPNFKSSLFNVGCDEVFGLKFGVCADEVRRVGEGRVYLDFLKKIFALVNRHQRQPAFWGDIILKYPELVAELPRDVIALEWGYEADHPFETHARLFQASGLRYFVCPGTSSWNSIAGRHANMLANIRNAVENGKKHGAQGVLLTDWGDCGHWQPLSVSYCAFVYAAALSWSVASAAAFNPVAAVDELFLRAPRCSAALILAELADIYLECGATCSNSTVLFNLLFKKGYLLPEGVTAARLRVIEEHLNSLSKRVTCVESARSAETASVKQEIEQIIRLLHAAVVRGRTMLNGAAPAGREQLIWRKMMDEICSVQLELWLKRNRPGGVRDSLERINTAY